MPDDSVLSWLMLVLAHIGAVAVFLRAAERERVQRESEE